MVFELWDFVKWALRTIKRYPCVIAWLKEVDAEDGRIGTIKDKPLILINNGLDLLNNLYEYDKVRQLEGLDESEWITFETLGERFEWLLEDCPFGKLEVENEMARFSFNCSAGMIELEQEQREVNVRIGGKNEQER